MSHTICHIFMSINRERTRFKKFGGKNRKIGTDNKKFKNSCSQTYRNSLRVVDLRCRMELRFSE